MPLLNRFAHMLTSWTLVQSQVPCKARCRAKPSAALVLKKVTLVLNGSIEKD